MILAQLFIRISKISFVNLFPTHFCILSAQQFGIKGKEGGCRRTQHSPSSFSSFLAFSCFFFSLLFSFIPLLHPSAYCGSAPADLQLALSVRLDVMSAAASYFSRRLLIRSAINGTVLLFSISGLSWLSLTRSKIVPALQSEERGRSFHLRNVALTHRVPPPHEMTTFVLDCISIRRFVCSQYEILFAVSSKISEMLIPARSAMI